MIKEIFNKFKNSFKKNIGETINENFIKQNKVKKKNEPIHNQHKIIKFNGKKYDFNFIDKDTYSVYKLFEKSNSKIQFFENLLKNLKLERDKEILKLKKNLQQEKSIS